MQGAQRRGARRREAIYLCPMRGGERRVPGAQEPTANREAGEAFDLFDPGFLQHRQGVTPGPDKDELGVQLALFAGPAVAHGDRPAAVGLPREVANLVPEQRGSAILHAIADELFGEGTEVDVGAVGGPVERHRLGEGPFSGHERQPAGEFVGTLDELGAGEQRVAGQRLLAAP